jgi:hypothetical protein
MHKDKAIFCVFMHILGLNVLNESLCERLILMDTILLNSCLMKLYVDEMRNEYKILVEQSGSLLIG